MKRNQLAALSTAAIMTMGVLGAPSTIAAQDMFIKIGDIEGESKDDAHKNEIDVLAWSWGSSANSTGNRSRNTGACIQDLSLTKWIDKASTDLIMGVTIGEQYDKALLTVRRGGGKESLEYLTLEMRDVSVSSYSTGGSGGEDRLTENVSLNFSEATWTYTEQKESGAPGAESKTVVSGSMGGCR